ncbi:MAG: transcriptional regulator [Zetaproteobacteria bacterium]|nr:MAG: transcriptional regulator [Zetaproteobacteria bacterium]
MENIRKTKGIPDTIDKHVGKQLRSRRTLLGLSQEKLAEYIGVTFQQVQKYERGTNRVSASRLYSFSKILDVSIDYFYEGIGTSGSSKTGVHGMSDNAQESFGGASISSKQSKNIPEDIFSKKETLDLIRTYYSIDDPKTRLDILKFIKSMVKNVA